MTLLGYAVENKSNPTPGALAYVLTGTRGAIYGLMRYRKHPHLMYAVRGSNGVICGLRGNYTFSDESGTLRCYYRG